MSIRRPKVFTDGRQRPIDPADRRRVMHLAHEARRRGDITRAGVDIVQALLFKFANLTDGRCFPSYARIAQAAGCCERTVGRCLPDLERAGLLTWRNRIRRVREFVAGIGGILAASWRVVRTSNAYDFPSASKQTPAILDKGHLSRGTHNPDLFSPMSEPASSPTPLEMAIQRGIELRRRLKMAGA